jgi:V/A-type H+-transporting ATPase subunit E
MAIEDILKALDDQAQADCEAVLEEARAHAKHIVDEAQREATEIHDNFVRQIERVATSEASKTINAARLESKMIVSSVKGDGVASTFETARKELPSLRGANYDALFAALAAEALADVSGSVTVHVAAADTGLAQSAVSAAGVDASIAGDLDAVGGLVVDLDGGRIIRRNTLEDRLDRASERVQADVARVLFS